MNPSEQDGRRVGHWALMWVIGAIFLLGVALVVLGVADPFESYQEKMIVIGVVIALMIVPLIIGYGIFWLIGGHTTDAQ